MLSLVSLNKIRKHECPVRIFFQFFFSVEYYGNHSFSVSLRYLWKWATFDAGSTIMKAFVNGLLLFLFDVLWASRLPYCYTWNVHSPGVFFVSVRNHLKRGKLRRGWKYKECRLSCIRVPYAFNYLEVSWERLDDIKFEAKFIGT